jgi:GNAT superfamily N-acetyltransferase
MHCQIVHDLIHRRQGWTLAYTLSLGDVAVGFGSVAIAGPWLEKPTVIEFYVLPKYRNHAFVLFESFLLTSGAKFMEVQSSDTLYNTMLHTYGSDIWSEKIVFHDRLSTTLPGHGAVLIGNTSAEETQRYIENRRGGPEWCLEVDGVKVATGGILFHYNRPYGDIYMEVEEPFRRRGYGAYLVQELKRLAYELDSIPCARCTPTNVASRNTLQKAGFVPCAHMLNGTIK